MLCLPRSQTEGLYCGVAHTCHIARILTSKAPRRNETAYTVYVRYVFFFALFFLLPQFALAGSATYSTPGTYTFTVPAYGSLTVTVNGAGGGGGGIYAGAPATRGGAGGTGGTSSFASVTAYGGSGGSGAGWSQTGRGSSCYPTPWNGSSGTATDGDSNTTGGGAGGVRNTHHTVTAAPAVLAAVP